MGWIFFNVSLVRQVGHCLWQLTDSVRHGVQNKCPHKVTLMFPGTCRSKQIEQLPKFNSPPPLSSWNKINQVTSPVIKKKPECKLQNLLVLLLKQDNMQKHCKLTYWYIQTIIRDKRHFYRFYIVIIVQAIVHKNCSCSVFPYLCFNFLLFLYHSKAKQWKLS